MSQKELQDRLKDLYSILSIEIRRHSCELKLVRLTIDRLLYLSVSIGITGVILLVSVMLFIILLDILSRN